ncbi:amino acid/amide ABC transporter membrane protein 2 (HAAT family) /amino acid/amide ABC transporter ATP-binding protein 1 (HAAT family) [Prauserella shujinwangii]|uniref:Amino acid/amide ABC transporter membrane protein 2 (HAAT family) /amino acid/amide ABC transporter ATP-binding protein 1 (HAAT family) n=1 Tax=Prauserella shujinwangii TaxID=1453103 RepID=A0A2T0M0N9_9PSEU|nr:ATP-binding cassette domain-containing protein [Prauserella shujinwangii]PRX50110.1 amino acid/amide ABC transporter membrane protein 2 (HAAT family) /amino acid/amide ABC transporter ATP-binding protein 1 (HAAT family) [Prauserella shujinwangii]
MIDSLRSRNVVAPVAILGLLFAACWLLAAQGNTYVVYLYGIGLVYATATLGLHLLVNDCGDISLAQGGQVALGAFVGAQLFPLVPGPLGPIVLVAGSILAGALAGAVVSLPMLKLRGLAVAVVTLLLNAAIFHFVLRFPDFVGGSGGLRLRPADWLPRSDADAVGWLTVLTIAVVLAVQTLRRSRFGLGLRAIRANEALARSAGVAVQWYRTAAYTVAGGTAGVAGAMWAILHHGVAPSAFTDASSLLLLTLALLGGRGSVAGPMAAAIGMGVLTGLLGGYGIVVSFAAPVALLFVLIKHPGGLNEQITMAAHGLRLLGAKLRRRHRDAGPPAEEAGAVVERAGSAAKGAGNGFTPDVPPPSADAPIALRCTDVDVTFGGLAAVSAVGIEVHVGEVLALVGPNGAGKTTLLNALSGHRRPDTGKIWLTGQEITHTPTHRRAALGLRRTFQVGGHMPAEPGFEHLRLGTHVQRSTSRGEVADRVARQLGLTQADLAAPVGGLAAGTARLVEIGMALAVPGQVLLLDEPTVGLTPDERRQLAGTLRALARDGLAIMLVDHDTAFIRWVAHRVVALDAGRIIAQGSPGAVFSDSVFVKAYLGSAEALV